MVRRSNIMLHRNAPRTTHAQRPVGDKRPRALFQAVARPGDDISSCYARGDLFRREMNGE